MKDAIGQDIKVGDILAYYRVIGDSGIRTKKVYVVGFTAKRVRVVARLEDPRVVDTITSNNVVVITKQLSE